MINTTLKHKIIICGTIIMIGLVSLGGYNQYLRYNQLSQQKQQIESKYEKLEQEFKDYKALHPITSEKPKESRGVSYMVYNTYSRVDTKTGITPTQLNKALTGTKLAGLGEYFVQAEQEYGVDAIFLSSIAALESGWGTSEFARERNNLFGFGSLDGSENEATVSFRTKGECILKVGKYLSKYYLTEGEQYYEGATPHGVNVKYSTNKTWDKQVTSIMNTIITKATN